MWTAVIVGLAVFSGRLSMLMGLLVGGRLLLLWRRTRKTPELLFGIMLLLGVVSGVFYTLYVTPGLVARDHLRAVRLTNLTLSALGGVVAALLPWRIFRPERLWAKLLVVVVAALYAGHLLGMFVPGHGLPRATEALPHMLQRTWMAAECLVYYGLLRRRLRLGLADPVVANRILLWGLATAANALSWVLLGLGWWVAILIWVPVIALNLAIPGIFASVCMWLAFFPPGAYTRWIERRHRERSGART